MAVTELNLAAPGPQHQNQRAETLYEEAQEAMSQDDFTKARRKLRQAHQADPQVGPQAEAVAILNKAVQEQPEKGFEKYMYLGQLLEGNEAISSMQKGVTVLQQQITQLDGEEKEEGQEQLTGALCALAERLLGEADDVEAVAGQCEQLLQQAQQACLHSPEPQQVLASLKVEQQKPQEALQHLQASMQKWYPALQKSMAEQSGSEDEEEEEELGNAEADDIVANSKPQATPDAAKQDGSESMSEAAEDLEEQLPSFEFRFETAKLLIELDDTTEAAVQILDSLIAEDDSVPNVWYMLAMCLVGGGEVEAAEEALQQGQLLLKKATDTEDLLKEFSELKVVIDAAAQAQQQNPE